MNKEIRARFQEFVGKRIHTTFDRSSQMWVIDTKLQHEAKETLKEVNDNCIVLEAGNTLRYIPFTYISRVWI